MPWWWRSEQLRTKTDEDLSEGRTTLRHLKIPRETECVRSQKWVLSMLMKTSRTVEQRLINRSPLLLSYIIITLSSWTLYYFTCSLFHLASRWQPALYQWAEPPLLPRQHHPSADQVYQPNCLLILETKSAISWPVNRSQVITSKRELTQRWMYFLMVPCEFILNCVPTCVYIYMLLLWLYRNTDKMTDAEKLPIAIAGIAFITLPFLAGMIALYAAK